MQNSKIFIVTGLAGSGKSTAIDAFEDSGFFCVDNMPVALLPKFLNLPIQRDAAYGGFAFVMDLRERGFLTEYTAVLEAIRAEGYTLEILYLEADEKTLLQRFSQTRRHHPAAGGKTLLDGIRYERDMLAKLRAAADRIVDTSHLNVHDLKAFIQDLARKNRKHDNMRIGILSFGFKYGLPPDANLLMDVRFLVNPYFVPELSPLDGRNPEVRNYVLGNTDSRNFLKLYLGMLDFLIPQYAKEGRAYLTVAIGCTGGRHRSVAVASAVYEHLKDSGFNIEISHRDIELKN